MATSATTGARGDPSEFTLLRQRTQQAQPEALGGPPAASIATPVTTLQRRQPYPTVEFVGEGRPALFGAALALMPDVAQSGTKSS